MEPETQSLKLETGDVIEVYRAGAEVAAAELDHDEWNTAPVAHLKRYWSGEVAPVERHAEARLIWSEAALCVRFICRQAEPLVVSASPQTERKTLGLWERDVCEIFIAPDVRTPERYFEFEAAPTGEWLDLAIQRMAHARETDWQYQSGMSAAARIYGGSVTIVMRVPWEAFGRQPQAGENWRANLFRCVGASPRRGYLAWRPTQTARPDFHVPQAFGWLHFKD